MNFTNKTFKRRFSINFFKNKFIPLGEMSFSKDFININSGDPYPLIKKAENSRERVSENLYFVSGSVVRYFANFFPYSTYEISAEAADGKTGFVFNFNNIDTEILFSSDTVFFQSANLEKSLPIKTQRVNTFIVSCRPSAFDIYILKNGKPEFVGTFQNKNFNNSNNYALFSNAAVYIKFEGNIVIHSAKYYIDCGISQADIRPIRYENGDVMIENGAVYFTLSARMQADCFQAVFSYFPSTCNFNMVGAVFYDYGDNCWCNDVAASILYNRKTKKWLLWVCSFSHGHILAHSEFDGDPRFGINVIDATLTEKAKNPLDITEFDAHNDDEDPDFIYDDDTKFWYMAICRMDDTIKNYRYVFFRSKSPFSGYEYFGKGTDGAETGGSFVKIDGELYFICGNSFNLKSNYRIYNKDGMIEAKFDRPDGGFRGWGTVFQINQGSRKRTYWLTFDRHNGSDYNWSYGNLYGFEL